jgi:hypothetical protein
LDSSTSLLDEHIPDMAKFVVPTTEVEEDGEEGDGEAGENADGGDESTPVVEVEAE